MQHCKAYRVTQSRRNQTVGRQVLVDSRHPDLKFMRIRARHWMHGAHFDTRELLLDPVQAVLRREDAQQLDLVHCGSDMSSLALTHILRAGLTRDTPLDQHVHGCARRATGSDERVEQEHLVHSRVRRKLRVVCRLLSATPENRSESPTYTLPAAETPSPCRSRDGTRSRPFNTKVRGCDSTVICSAQTYGKRLSRASVIPIPARRMGVSPMLGLITEPVNGPTGVS